MLHEKSRARRNAKQHRGRRFRSIDSCGPRKMASVQRMSESAVVRAELTPESRRPGRAVRLVTGRRQTDDSRVPRAGSLPPHAGHTTRWHWRDRFRAGCARCQAGSTEKGRLHENCRTAPRYACRRSVDAIPHHLGHQPTQMRRVGASPCGAYRGQSTISDCFRWLLSATHALAGKLRSVPSVFAGKHPQMHDLSRPACCD